MAAHYDKYNLNDSKLVVFYTLLLGYYCTANTKNCNLRGFTLSSEFVKRLFEERFVAWQLSIKLARVTHNQS